MIKVNIPTKTVANEIVGKLSKTSKLPCASISLDAIHCNAGSKLNKVKGSPCENCYARKGFYRMPVVKDAMERRLKALNNPLWIPAMVKLLKDSPLFRWFDSGDIQDNKHLRQIIEVCQDTLNTVHWLPTQERGLIKAYARDNQIPDNLVIRVSSPMKDRVKDCGIQGVYNSVVITDKANANGAYICPAYSQRGQCKDCRACWNKSINTIAYLEH